MQTYKQLAISSIVLGVFGLFLFLIAKYGLALAPLADVAKSLIAIGILLLAISILTINTPNTPDKSKTSPSPS